MSVTVLYLERALFRDSVELLATIGLYAEGNMIICYAVSVSNSVRLSDTFLYCIDTPF